MQKGNNNNKKKHWINFPLLLIRFCVVFETFVRNITKESIENLNNRTSGYIPLLLAYI